MFCFVLLISENIIAQNYPTPTSRGDNIEAYFATNNVFEIGLRNAENARRSWILSRHYNLTSYGHYYSSLHLQPDIGDKSQYRGVAIGFNPSAAIPISAHLVVNGKTGIGVFNPISQLDIKGTSFLRAASTAGVLSEQLRIGRHDSNIRYHSIYSIHNSGASNNYLQFRIHDGGSSPYYSQATVMTLFGNGRVGIGTTSTGTHRLAVEGTIGAREVKVETGTWSDFVFNGNYKLRSLHEVEHFIQEYKHLPDVPSEKEVIENGIELGKMDANLLQKIEELTLYIIQQQKEIESLKTDFENYKKAHSDE